MYMNGIWIKREQRCSKKDENQEENGELVERLQD